MDRSARLTRRVFVLVLLVSVVAFSRMLGAQEESPVCDPAAGCITEPPADVVEAHEAEFRAEAALLLQRSILDFDIAYLVDETQTPLKDVLSPANFEKVFGADVFSSWEKFVNADRQSAYQVVFIHASMLDQVDSTWAKTAYINKTIFIGLDTSFTPLAALVGDACLDHASPTIEQYFDTVARLIFVSPEGSTSSESTAWAVQYLEACQTSSKAKANAMSVSLSIPYPLHTVDDLNNIANSILSFSVTFDVPAVKTDHATLPMPTASTRP